MVDTNKRDMTIAKKIMAEIDDIKEFVSGMDENDFYSDLKTQKAVVMSLINIGELSKAFSDAFVKSRINIPWKKVQAMRNVAAHRYDFVDMQIVWDTIQISIEELRDDLSSVIT